MAKPTYKLPEGVASIREYRKEVSTLKKRGLISKEIDARKVTPSSYLTRSIRKFAGVISGKQSVYTVKKGSEKETAKAIKLLKDQGYTVTKGKVIVGKQEYVTKGIVRVRGGNFESGRVKYRNLESAIRKAFEGAKEGEFLAYTVYGWPARYTFGDAGAAIDWIINTYDPLIDEGREGAFSLAMLGGKDIKRFLKKAANAQQRAKEKRQKVYRSTDRYKKKREEQRRERRRKAKQNEG